MRQPRHILICGEVGVGKSTLIGKLLSHNERPVYGFITKKCDTDEDGEGKVYIHAANAAQRIYTDENLIGICGASGAQRYPDVFDSLGVRLLNAAPEGLLLMDELGFLESKAPMFCAGVLKALDGDIPILAAVKTKETPFLKAVREHGNAILFMITRDNRDALYDEILPLILAWNDESRHSK
jgi:nucleoside-triphosphatase